MFRRASYFQFLKMSRTSKQCDARSSRSWQKVVVGKTPDGFVEHHQRVPRSPVRRLKLVTLNAANEVVGVDYVSGSGYSLDDFNAVIEALSIGDGEPQSDYW